MGKIFYIMGKSSSGKDTIYSRLLCDEGLNLQNIVLHTTRPIRDGEEEGREYHFTDKYVLENLEKQGKVIESRTYQTVYGPWTYFTADDGQVELAGIIIWESGRWNLISRLKNIMARKMSARFILKWRMENA